MLVIQYLGDLSSQEDVQYLGDLSSQEEYGLLKKQRITLATEMHKIAQAKGANILVCSKESERFYHLPIFNDGKHYYAKFGRVISTAEIKKGTSHQQ